MPAAIFGSTSYLPLQKHQTKNKSTGYEGGVPRTPIGKLVSVSVSKDEFDHDESVKTIYENNPSSNGHLGWHCLHWSSNLPPLHLLGGRSPGKETPGGEIIGAQRITTITTHWHLGHHRHYCPHRILLNCTNNLTASLKCNHIPHNDVQNTLFAGRLFKVLLSMLSWRWSKLHHNHIVISLSHCHIILAFFQTI